MVLVRPVSSPTPLQYVVCVTKIGTCHLRGCLSSSSVSSQPLNRDFFNECPGKCYGQNFHSESISVPSETGMLEADLRETLFPEAF